VYHGSHTAIAREIKGTEMQLTGKTATRYVEAVERQNALAAAYNELLAAQLAHDQPRINAAQADVDEIEGDTDY
jgi:hypothetical protein